MVIEFNEVAASFGDQPLHSTGFFNVTLLLGFEEGASLVSEVGGLQNAADPVLASEATRSMIATG